MISSKGALVSLLLVTICLHSSMVLGGDFTWQDCGVQLTKDIHYVSASISPSTVGSSGPLSINVRASITSKIYNSDTQLVVYKDGERYLDVEIQDLCSIISTTKSLTCPLNIGPISFTYTFQSLPVLPVGHYTFQIRNSDIGCLQLSATAGSLIGSSNFQTSTFIVTLAGSPTFGTQSVASRKAGDTIALSNGQFKSLLVASTDLGGTVDLSKYNWDMQGALLVDPTVNGSVMQMTYTGFFSVSSPAETLLGGLFNWSYSYNLVTGDDGIVGTFTPTPVYTFSPNFTYPIVFGNLAPFQVQRQQDKTFVVSANRKWCTAGVDKCGVCGGDGSTCTLAVAQKSDKMPDKQVAAIVIGVAGGLLGIVAVIILATMLRRARRAPRYDDADLIDHPVKPDYGTMAIDDIMREGERATY